MVRKKTVKELKLNFDPDALKTDKVQYWSKGGVMLTAEMPLEKAKRLVRERKAFVVSNQAISQIPD